MIRIMGFKRYDKAGSTKFLLLQASHRASRSARWDAQYIGILRSEIPILAW